MAGKTFIAPLLLHGCYGRSDHYGRSGISRHAGTSRAIERRLPERPRHAGQVERSPEASELPPARLRGAPRGIPGGRCSRSERTDAGR